MPTPNISITKNGKKIESNKIKQLIHDLRRQDGKFDREGATPRQLAVLEQDVKQYVEEYNLCAEQVADEREYQWTIDAYIHCRVGDAWMGEFRHILQQGKCDVSSVDTKERLTHKPTVWLFEQQQRAEAIQAKRRQLKKNSHHLHRKNHSKKP